MNLFHARFNSQPMMQITSSTLHLDFLYWSYYEIINKIIHNALKSSLPYVFCKKGVFLNFSLKCFQENVPTMELFLQWLLAAVL